MRKAIPGWDEYQYDSSGIVYYAGTNNPAFSSELHLPGPSVLRVWQLFHDGDRTAGLFTDADLAAVTAGE